MQGGLCAYCEGSLETLGSHIEHFRTRDGHPQLTFVWTNLLWCCDRSDSCGHHKDTKGRPYDVSNLIDPTTEEPDLFFRFNQNGTISVRDGLPPVPRKRAEETIRALGLDAEFGRLRQMRRLAVAAYHAQEPGMLEVLMTFSPEERRNYVREELVRTAREPFCTVIRHLFEGLA
jgi:uncharacterized protein (TIGR02646 family)